MVYGFGMAVSLALGTFALLGLVFGAEVVVDRLKALACYYEIPDVLIAVSVVSIGTSLPEITAHVVASIGILTGTLNYEIASATVLGANIGSDVVQQTLVVGLVVLFGVVHSQRDVFEFEASFLKQEYFPMVGTTLMCIVLGWDGIYSRLDGLILVGSFVGYMYYLFHTKEHRFATKVEKCENPRQAALVAGVAMIGVILSAHVLLALVEEVVAATGLGGSLIGVVTLGVASALPEMITAIEGIRQNASGISLGTLIGSNVTNPLLAIGGGAVISTYWVPRPLVLWDLPMETITAAALLGYLLFVSDRKLGWKGGLYLIGLYAVYIVVRVLYFAVD